MADDLHDLLETLGLTGRDDVHAGRVVDGRRCPAAVLGRSSRVSLASLTLMAPISPYGFGGCRGAEGEPCTPDWAGTGAGTAAPGLRAPPCRARRDSAEDPQSAPREVLLTFFGPGKNRPNVDADFLVAELLTTTVGDDNYPGDGASSEHWPNVGPGTRGVMNSMSGKYLDTSALGDLVDGPPITWLRATADQVVSDRSMFDLATLGELGVVPGWPGADVMPSQPMETQLRAVLERYADNGGRWREVALDGVAHGIPLEVPEVVATEIERTMAGA